MGAPPPATPDPIEILAPRIEWTPGAAVAGPGVELRVGDVRVTAERATWRPGTLELERGTIWRDSGPIQFERAFVALDTRDVELEGLAAAVGIGALRAEAASVPATPPPSPGVAWTGERVDWTPCLCPDGGPPAITVRARRVGVRPARFVVATGVVVRVFEVPILPLPLLRAPLDPRRFHLEIPQLGHTGEGWAAAWYARFGIAETDVRAGLFWRGPRGGGAAVELTAPSGRVAAQGAWDLEQQRARGSAAGRGGVARGRWIAAWDLDVQSDADWAVDYSPAHLARGVAWRRSRGRVGGTPADGVLAEVFGDLPDDGSAAALAAARVRGEWGRASGPTAWRAGAQAQAAAGRASGEPGWASTFASAAPVAGIGVDASGTWTPGVISVDARAAADGAIDLSALEAPVVAHAASVAVHLPLWTTAGASTVRIWPGLAAAAHDGAAGAGALLHLDGGSRRARWTVDGRWFVDDRGESRVGGAVTLTGARASLRLGGDPGAAYAEVSGDDTAIGWRVGGAALRADVVASAAPSLRVAASGGAWLATPTLAGDYDAALLWADATLRPGRLRLGGGFSVDPLADTARGVLSVVEGRVGYDDGCASAAVTVRSAADREGPELGLVVNLRR